MKTLLLSLLLIASAAQAEQWLVNGRACKGTLHKLNADQTLVWVTSDWGNYAGSWLKVSELDSLTRVRLNAATPQEQAAVMAERRQMEANRHAERQQQQQRQSSTRIYIGPIIQGSNVQVVPQIPRSPVVPQVPAVRPIVLWYN